MIGHATFKKTESKNHTEYNKREREREKEKERLMIFLPLLF
jgi:hypothetical protein